MNITQKVFTIRTNKDNKLHAIQSPTEYIALVTIMHKGYDTRNCEILSTYKIN